MYNNSGSSGNSSPTLTNCSFQANVAFLGGAMSNRGSDGGTSSPSLTNCSFQANVALDGGAMSNNSGTSGTSSPTLTNCSFQGNTASGYRYGGAMYNQANDGGISSPSLTNCSFQANVAFLGGAMFSDGDGTLGTSSPGTSSPSLTNCVLFGNGGGKTIGNISASVSARYSLFDASVTGYLTGPGNLTATASPFASNTSTQLVPCSYAIDAGDPASTTASVGSTDLAGNPRIVSVSITHK
jgi:hypothetical protein